MHPYITYLRTVLPVTFGMATEEQRIDLASVLTKINRRSRRMTAKRIEKTLTISKGWMYKKGPQRWSAWKRRFFVFLSTEELLYYDSDNGGTMKGVVNLKEAEGERYTV